MLKLRKLNCGLRMVLDYIPEMQSVTVGMWVNAGCVDETPENSGISHFIEHMMFKGTKKRSAREIASELDALGAQSNAFTAKENTCYYIKSLSSNLDKACDVLIDMMTESVFDPVEMEKEKQVVKEEMKMVEDAPDDDVQDMLYEQLFKGEELSHSILGKPETLDAITHDDIVDYIASEYALDQIVVSVAGNFDEEKVCEQFENRLLCMSKIKNKRNHIITDYKPSFRTKVKDIEQSHICLGTRTMKFGDKDAYALSILNNIMGGSMSSRLFQNIREEKGLAYSVYSYISFNDLTGFYGINAGISHDNIEATLEAIKEELVMLKESGVTADEMETSRTQIKANYIFSLENTGSRMVSNGRRVLLRNNVKTPQDIISEIDAVTMDDVSRVAALITDISTYSGTLIGRRDLEISELLQ